MSNRSGLPPIAAEHAIRIAPGDGIVVHHKPLTVVVAPQGDPERAAEGIGETVARLIDGGDLGFGPVATGLQQFVVDHQPLGVAAVLDIHPDPIAFLFDQASAIGNGVTHRASGRAGWTTVFIEGDSVSLVIGEGPEQAVVDWSSLWAGTTPGQGAQVGLSRAHDPDAPPSEATEAPPATPFEAAPAPEATGDASVADVAGVAAVGATAVAGAAFASVAAIDVDDSGSAGGPSSFDPVPSVFDDGPFADVTPTAFEADETEDDVDSGHADATGDDLEELADETEFDDEGGEADHVGGGYEDEDAYDDEAEDAYDDEADHAEAEAEDAYDDEADHAEAEAEHVDEDEDDDAEGGYDEFEDDLDEPEGGYDELEGEQFGSDDDEGAADGFEAGDAVGGLREQADAADADVLDDEEDATGADDPTLDEPAPHDEAVDLVEESADPTVDDPDFGATSMGDPTEIGAAADELPDGLDDLGPEPDGDAIAFGEGLLDDTADQDEDEHDVGDDHHDDADLDAPDDPSGADDTGLDPPADVEFAPAEDEDAESAAIEGDDPGVVESELPVAAVGGAVGEVEGTDGEVGGEWHPDDEPPVATIVDPVAAEATLVDEAGGPDRDDIAEVDHDGDDLTTDATTDEPADWGPTDDEFEITADADADAGDEIGSGADDEDEHHHHDGGDGEDRHNLDEDEDGGPDLDDPDATLFRSPPTGDPLTTPPPPNGTAAEPAEPAVDHDTEAAAGDVDLVTAAGAAASPAWAPPPTPAPTGVDPAGTDPAVPPSIVDRATTTSNRAKRSLRDGLASILGQRRTGRDDDEPANVPATAPPDGVTPLGAFPANSLPPAPRPEAGAPPLPRAEPMPPSELRPHVESATAEPIAGPPPMPDVGTLPSPPPAVSSPGGPDLDDLPPPQAEPIAGPPPMPGSPPMPAAPTPDGTDLDDLPPPQAEPIAGPPPMPGEPPRTDEPG